MSRTLFSTSPDVPSVSLRQRPRRLLATTALTLVTLSACLASGVALAWQGELDQIKNRWESVTTSSALSAQEAPLTALAAEARALSSANPNVSELLVWEGIIEASLAKAKGGLGALDNAKAARRALERAIALDANGLEGSAYVTLGALYDRAPGWPVAFGDDDKAEEMFKRALAIRPGGVDVNYYYAAYLADEGRDAEARQHAEKAINGAVRAGREASDQALKAEARALLNEL
ncbi:hypothetical protein LCL99_12155 [Halomonas denitrificans]|uniref:hypothetical protein n=1 Tax=Halomonas TaxID=2745 RepID=UPI001CD1CF9D|nr:MULTISPECIES: hypothetical protein [Halomonas]MCA0916702.1 hypothetical protein [Halomonas denitrificans]MCA0975228.1 hypothetical protein [Halomonas denitrificans]MED5295544.1 hypothetical protein [Pseudomonadota bacterium]